MKRFLKQVLLFITLLILGINLWALPKSFGQNFVPPMEVVHEDSSITVIALNLSDEEQFAIDSCEPTSALQGYMLDNQSALVKLYENSTSVTVFGLQDDIGDYKRSLGECRGDAGAKAYNDLLYMNDKLPLVQYASNALSNETQSRIGTKVQEYLNSRSVLIVGYKPVQNLGPIQQIQQKIADLRNGMWGNFWWILGLALALAGLLLWLLFGGRDRRQPTADSNSPNRPVGNTDNGNNAEPDENRNGDDGNESADESREIPHALDPSSRGSQSESRQTDNSGGSEVTVNVYDEFHGEIHLHG